MYNNAKVLFKTETLVKTERTIVHHISATDVRAIILNSLHLSKNDEAVANVILWDNGDSDNLEIVAEVTIIQKVVE